MKTKTRLRRELEASEWALRQYRAMSKQAHQHSRDLARIANELRIRAEKAEARNFIRAQDVQGWPSLPELEENGLRVHLQ